MNMMSFILNYKSHYELNLNMHYSIVMFRESKARSFYIIID